MHWGSSQSLRAVPEEDEDREGSAVKPHLHWVLLWCKAGLGPSVWSEQNWLFGFFCLSVVHPKVILPRQILDTKWESVLQKNVNHLLSSVTAGTSGIIHVCELSRDLFIWAK